MFYAIISQDVPNSLTLRQSVRDEHLARLRQLKDEGRLIIAGPHPAVDSENPGDAGFTGSLVVAEFPDLAAAKKWADNDPYITARVYEKVTVKPFKKVLP
ncbi:MAG: YciI family protein [Gammaproteobacteria bacterium]|nr:YciI family protein [Gammaproteobacteria bacterium]